MHNVLNNFISQKIKLYINFEEKPKYNGKPFLRLFGDFFITQVIMVSKFHENKFKKKNYLAHSP